MNGEGLKEFEQGCEMIREALVVIMRAHKELGPALKKIDNAIELIEDSGVKLNREEEKQLTYELDDAVINMYDQRQDHLFVLKRAARLLEKMG